MSEFFTGITFPQQKVTPSDDAVVRRAVLADSILSGCALTYAGSTLTMGPGMLIACGRQFRHTSVQNWAVTGATSGYARLVLTIDTTRASTKDVFDQITTDIEYASAVDGFLDLQQDDINEAGTIYQMQICIVSLSAGGITGIISKLIDGGGVMPDFKESEEHPGCYYRMVDGEQEWLNPPMETDVEYRTKERWKKKPVYVKRMSFGVLPDNAIKSVEHGIANAINNIIQIDDLVWKISSDVGRFPLMLSGEIAAYYYVDDSAIFVKAIKGTNSYRGTFTIYFFK